MKPLIFISLTKVVLGLVLTFPVSANADDNSYQCWDAAEKAAVAANGEELREAYEGSTPYCYVSESERVHKFWDAIYGSEDHEGSAQAQAENAAKADNPKVTFRVWVLCPTNGKTLYEVTTEAETRRLRRVKCKTDVKRIEKLY